MFFNWLDNWLKQTIKDAQEIDKAIKAEDNNLEQNVCVCKYESNTSDCSLVQQLKEKQANKKAVDNDIKSYEKYDLSIVQYVRKFLTTLEEHNFCMDKHYRFSGEGAVDFMFNNFCGVGRLEEALYYISNDDIDNMAKELKSLKQRTIIINELKSVSKALENDIADIKEKLGIE